VTKSRPPRVKTVEATPFHGPATVALTQPLSSAETVAVSTPPTSNLRTNILRALALFAVIAITVYIFSIRDKVEQFKNYGYLGVFLVALAANATVLIPAPGVAIISAMGAVFNAWGVGLAAGTGGALGELSGYLAGFSGQAFIERAHIYERIHPWVEKYGGWAILVLSAIPNPFFDVAGIAAGMIKMPLRTFLFSVWVGQLIKMTLFAFAGKYSIAAAEYLIK
jgi:membrane protein DedA with SNARE-associated domain